MRRTVILRACLVWLSGLSAACMVLLLMCLQNCADNRFHSKFDSIVGATDTNQIIDIVGPPTEIIEDPLLMLQYGPKMSEQFLNGVKLMTFARSAPPVQHIAVYVDKHTGAIRLITWYCF